MLKDRTGPAGATEDVAGCGQYRPLGRAAKSAKLQPFPVSRPSEPLDLTLLRGRVVT